MCVPGDMTSGVSQRHHKAGQLLYESLKWRISHSTLAGCLGVGSNRSPVSFFEDKMKRLGNNIDQAEYEKARQLRELLRD